VKTSNYITFLRRLRKTAKIDYELRHVWMSVRPRGNTWLHLERFSWNLSSFWKSVEKIQGSLKSDKKMGTSHKDLCIVISPWILLRMRNVLDKIFRENQNMHFTFNNFFSENRASCEIMWKIVVRPDRSQTTM
jgi:hypothetical protein